MIINFKDDAHKKFFMQAQELCREWDSYHKALFYCLGINKDCRTHLDDIFCFDRQNYGIKPDTVFNKAWQTSGSMECIRLGYNLFNGYTDDYTSPYELFCGGYTCYLLEAIKLRYPNTFSDDTFDIVDDKGNVLEDGIPQFLAELYLEMHEEESGSKCEIKPHKPITLDID